MREVQHVPYVMSWLNRIIYFQIRPVCLPCHPSLPCESSNRTFEGATATVTGWGQLQDGIEEYPDVLQKIETLTVLPFGECQLVPELGEDTIIPETDVCAVAEGRDACQGDSGGNILDDVKNI